MQGPNVLLLSCGCAISGLVCTGLSGLSWSDIPNASNCCHVRFCNSCLGVRRAVWPVCSGDLTMPVGQGLGGPMSSMLGMSGNLGLHASSIPGRQPMLQPCCQCKQLLSYALLQQLGGLVCAGLAGLSGQGLTMPVGQGLGGPMSSMLGMGANLGLHPSSIPGMQPMSLFGSPPIMMIPTNPLGTLQHPQLMPIGNPHGYSHPLTTMQGQSPMLHEHLLQSSQLTPLPQTPSLGMGPPMNLPPLVGASCHVSQVLRQLGK